MRVCLLKSNSNVMLRVLSFSFVRKDKRKGKIPTFIGATRARRPNEGFGFRQQLMILLIDSFILKKVRATSLLFFFINPCNQGLSFIFWVFTKIIPPNAFSNICTA